MSATQENLIDELSRRCLPEWKELPDLSLYMDQLLSLVGRYLPSGGEDKPLTAAMVNNYVKHKVLPPPVSKRYTRLHIAALLMLCILKSVMPIAAIQQLFESAGGPEGIPGLYSEFREIYASVNQAAAGQALKSQAGVQQQFLGAALDSQAAQALAMSLLPTLKEQ